MHLLKSEAARIEAAPTADLQAYDLYLLGRFQLNKRTDDGLRRAIAHFEQATARDPEFAVAYAGIADAFVLAGIGYAAIPSDVAVPKAKAAAARAIELDSSLADAHTSLAYVELNYGLDWSRAQQEFERAIELSPSDARAHQWYAHWFLYHHRFAEGAPYIDRACELDPRSPLMITESGWPPFYLGDFERALERFRAALAIDPNFALAHFNCGNVYDLLGRHDAAAAELREAVQLSNHAPVMVAFLAAALARAGQREEARTLVEEVLEHARAGVPLSPYIASVYEALGDKEQAYAWLERAAKNRELLILAVGTNWMPFPSMRDELRFRTLAESHRAWIRTPAPASYTGRHK